LDAVTDIAGTGLDSSSTRPTNYYPPVLVQKSARTSTRNTKTSVVVAVARIVVVTIRRATVFRIVVPGTTAQHLGVPAPSSPLDKVYSNLLTSEQIYSTEEIAVNLFSPKGFTPLLPDGENRTLLLVPKLWKS
jgi:hypothetical protein